MSLAVPSITYGVVLFVTPCQTVAHAAANTMVHSWHRPCSAAKKHRCCKVGHTLSILFGCALLWLLLGAVVFVLSCDRGICPRASFLSAKNALMKC